MKDFKKLVIIFVGFALWSCEEIIEVPDISDKNVEILAPLESSELFTNQVNFNWSSVENAEEYRFQIADPSFTGAQQIIVDSLVSGTTFYHEFVNDGSYEWRIKAINSAYETPYSTAGFDVNP